MDDYSAIRRALTIMVELIEIASAVGPTDAIRKFCDEAFVALNRLERGGQMSLDVSLHIVKRVCIFDSNITHNLGKMADAAGIYYACWRPEEINAKQAKDIIPILEKGLADLKARPKYFEQFNSPDGWGMYEHFVPWVEEYLYACKTAPEAEIKISR